MVINSITMKFPERLFNDTSVPVMIFGTSGKLLWTNEVFERMFGHPQSDQKTAQGQPFLSTCHSERLKSIISQALIGIPMDSIDIPLAQSADGPGDIQWNTILIHDEEDPKQKAVVFFGVEEKGNNGKKSDIQSMDALYRILFENTGIAMMFFAEDSKIMLVNKEFEKLTGYRKDQIEGRMSWTKLIDNKNDLDLMNRYHRLRKINPALAPNAYDIHIRTMEGGIRDIMIRVSIIPDTSYTLVSMMDVTESRLIEKNLRRSEEKYRTLVENIRYDTLYRCDLNGDLTFVSPSGARLLGYDSFREMLGLNIARDFYYIPEERTQLLNELNINGNVANYEITLKRKDGSPVFISANSHLYFDNNGKVLGVEGVFSDITKRKEAERLLREKEERLRGITDNLPGIVFQFFAKENGEYSISYASERTAKVLGSHPKTDDLFRRFLSILYKEDRERFDYSLKWAVETCTPWDFIGRFIDPSDNVKWFHGMATPTRHEDILIFNGILMDITGRKHAEHMSRQSEEKFSKIFMTTPDFISITRMKDGMIIDVNRGFEDMTGWKRKEVIGQRASDIGLWNNLSDRDFMVEELMAGREVMHREFILKCKDGSLRTGIYSARPIRIENELCVVFVMQDITDELRMEEERRKLEHQLTHSQRMDAIGQLAGGLAHDFNNILMGMQGNISLMLMECGSGNPYYQRLNQIQEHIKRGANLTKQLLGFARGGKYEVKTISVNDLIRKSAHLFLETKKSIHAEFHLEDDVYPVDADPGQIEQVLLNIYINAGHAMPKGGSLTVQTNNITVRDGDIQSFEIKPGNYVKISVSDTGTGIDKGIIDKIFEPFFTTKSEQGGTGLGLASAYGIIKNHGGDITVYSEPGQGTTFHIYLPSSVETTDEDEGLSAKGCMSGTGGVLVIDDESMILETASDILETLGYSAYKASSGQEAIEMYREKQNDIDLIILDMVMPEMSGSQALKIIKEINPDARVILSSGYSMQGEVRELMEMGCKAFIQKPYNLKDLSDVVYKTLNP